MREVWKPIPGYERHYAVSNLGRVKTLERQVNARTNTGKRTVPSKILKFDDTTPGGYLRVGLSKDGIVRRLKVAHLVLLAFVGPRPPGEVSRHLDGSVDNNNLKNLRWGTRKENEADKIRHGTYVQRGEGNGNARLSDADIAAIRASRKLQKELAREYGVSKVWISMIKTGKVRK